MRLIPLALTTFSLLLTQTSAQGIGGGAAELPLTTNAKPEPTTVWVRQTLPNGAVTVIPSVYTQKFATVSTTATWSSGSVGMGTQTGNVGVVKSKEASAGVVVGGECAWLVALGVGAMGILGGGLLVF